MQQMSRFCSNILSTYKFGGFLFFTEQLFMFQYLQRILDKGIELQTMTKLCADLEPNSFIIKQYSVKDLEKSQEIIKSDDKPFDVLKKIEGFRDHLYCIKDENNLIKQKRNNLIEENNKLKYSLRNYLANVSKIPSIRPQTRA